MQPSFSIWTIGHSTKSLSEFLGLLKGFDIQLLVDVRHFPGSRKFPHFNKENLCYNLEEAKIRYMHLESLGGRRKAKMIPSIQGGAIRHSGDMPITWQLKSSSAGLNNLRRSLRNFEPQ